MARRRSPGWVPNQHGAWAMLASPLLVGVLHAGPTWVHLPLGVFWFAGYFAFYATSVWLKSGRRARHARPAAVYLAVAAVAGTVVALADPSLLRWAPLFAVPLGVGLLAAAARRERELLSGLTMTMGSALMTVVAADAGRDPDLRTAWVLAAVQAAYFCGTVFYVKSAIRERGNKRFLAQSVAFHALCTLVVGWVSLSLAIVFASLTVRAYVVPPRRPTPKALGIGEIVATVVVAATSLLTA
ncbi:MAG: YwiC-like family protein [Nocardioides sp.]|uniref:YwiC-like family protein n=1 Tax=Nocardioides sp. TaxID=35761 RepID=UPI003EFFC6D6